MAGMKNEKLPSIRRYWGSMSEMRQMLLSTITSLDEFLSESAKCAKARERREFDEVLNSRDVLRRAAGAFEPGEFPP
jgi:hypothetical protein